MKIAPTSFAQRRLWFLEQLSPGNSAYNMSAAFRFSEELDLDALRRTLDELVRRHETLRTSFVEKDWQPVQVVAPAAGANLTVIDLGGMGRGAQLREIGHLAGDQARRPFDMARGPLLRSTVVRVSNRSSLLYMTLHHIVSDGWSMGVIRSELEQIYEAFRAGQPTPLPELGMQYADFSAWQREHLSGERLGRLVAYWTERLGGAPALLELPTDKPRPPIQTYRGARQVVQLPRRLSDELEALSHAEGATIFITLLAAFAVLLGRYSGQQDIVIGSPVAGRNRTELEDLVGFFVNVLVMRTDLSGNPTFRELIGRVRESAVGAYAHEDLPFEYLVDQLAPDRDASHSPVFQVMFNLQTTKGAAAGLAGTQRQETADTPASAISRVRGTRRGLEATSKFDLTLSLLDTDRGVRGWMEYNTDLFRRPTIRRMLDQLVRVLEAGVADPDCAIDQLPLLTQPDLHRLLVEWNETAADHDLSHCLHELFELQASRTPRSTAIVFEGSRLTYGELDARANRLANHLRDLAVGPDVLVGIYMERSLEMVVALLAVLKAGGAFVPLDPGLPRERIAYMLEDAGCPVLLTQDALLESVPESSAAVVPVDGGWAATPDQSRRPAVTGIDARSLAYVMYTSGSTGKPKGVMVPHRGLVNHMLWRQSAHHLNPSDRVLHKATLNFDASIWELFWPLSSGASVYLAAPGGQVDTAYLARFIAENQLTILHFVPSVLAPFLEEPGVEACDCVRYVVSGGEALSPELKERFFARMDADLYQSYGPTEASIAVVFNLCERGGEGGRVPLGRPIDNVRIHLLDANLELVPIGVPGEIHIGGAAVARGYLGQPELSAARFIRDPFSADPDDRLYRTGDLAKYLPDGRLEFVGRVDHQVKIRGVRIEPGEIESLLRQHVGVKEAIVVAREDTPGDLRLVAYLTAEEHARPHAGELRTSLLTQLPDYMVPSAFVLLDALPLNAMGKLDRPALPAPEGTVVEQRGEYVAPSSAEEAALAEIWAEVLGAGKVGVHDNFFELGGHSLLATQLVARIRDRFRRELPVRSLFENPTVATLAARLDIEGREITAPGRTIPRRRHGGTAPLSFAQQRLWFLHQLAPESSAYNMSTSIRLREPVNAAALAQSVNELVRRHEPLRTSFAGVDGKPVQVIAPELDVPLGEVDLTGLTGGFGEAQAEFRRLSQEQARRPFDLSHGPLLRSTLFRLPGGNAVLFLTMHHVVSDGWSVAVIKRELRRLYPALAAGRPSPLDALPITYADFAAWQHDGVREGALKDQLVYWRQQLAGIPPVLDLPGDRPRPPIQSFRGRRRFVDLPRGLSRRLERLARSERATLFMTLLAAWQALLHRYTGQDDIVVGSPIAGRAYTELENLVGVFVNTVALRARITGEESFRALLRQVREVVLGAFAHQDVPFEKLVEELAPERTLSRSPIFQVMFILQPPRPGQPPSRDPRQVEDATAKYDLTLSMTSSRAGLRGTLEFNSDLFDDATAGRLLRHLKAILRAAAASPDLAVAELPLLSAAEQRQLARSSRGPRLVLPPRPRLHRLFEAQAERTPAAVAVECGPDRLTYRELNQRANQVAYHLRALGVKPGARVGVCVQRSLAMYPALLGVLKSGAAYVPMDASYPKSRLAFMLEDAQVSVLLTQEQLVAELPAHDARVFRLDSDSELLARHATHNLPANQASPPAAYVIYTSGSTGRPKGVVGLHRATVNRLQWMWERYPFQPGEVASQKTALSFVDSIWELFGPLLQGVPSVVVTDAEVKDPSRLVDALARAGVTRLVLVPSLLRVVLDSCPDLRARLPRLQFWVCSGEAIPAELARRFHARMPGARLLNLYGSSEVAGDATCYETSPDDCHPTVPIGRPIANTQVHILDGNLQPVPPGVPGQLYVGGANLAAGYLGRTDLTAERFLPDPFCRRRGSRLYWTGDLARQLPDGNLEYLGRADHQVKIRGFRVELGEIETLLSDHAAVAEACVLLREDVPGDRRLAAYVVGARGAGHEVSPAGLRRHLRSHLPEHMVPATVTVLEALPLTPNGKLDRTALPAPELDRAGSAVAFAAPESEAERAVARIWSELLGVETVGLDDNFFDLGGHSLMATQVTARIRDNFRVDLPLRTLFESPTVAGLAAHLEDGGQKLLEGDLIPRRSPNLSIPLSFPQRRLWFLEQLRPGSRAYVIPGRWRLSGRLDAGALQRSLDELVRRHESLRTTFTELGGEPVQVVSPSLSVKLPVADLRSLRPAERELELRRIAQELMRKGFDLQRGPLLRAHLVRLAERKAVLLYSVHHIVSDGWSMRILNRELRSLYEAFSAGRPSPLPELPIQYADFAAWQRDSMHGRRLGRQLAYWRRQLRGVPELIELPSQRQRPPVQSLRGARRTAVFPPRLARGLKKLSRERRATLFMTLMAAFQLLLHRYSGQDDIAVGTPIAGRPRTELEGMVGFFVNSLVLRAGFASNPTFTKLLDRGRKTALGAYANQELPFERVVEALAPKRNLSFTPLFQVMFVMRGGRGGGRAAASEFQPETAKFDLTLSVDDNDDGLRVSLDYCTDLFDAAFVERMLGHYGRLLESIAEDPERRVAELPMLTGAEITRQLVELNSVPGDNPRDLCLHELFEVQAERTPDAVALLFGECRVTFGELNQRANQLAFHLRAIGVRPDRPVGFCVDRSVEMVVGLLAVMKAGGAYVPLDPFLPPERLRMMLKDARAKIMVTSSDLLGLVPDHGGKVVCLDRDAEAIARHRRHNPKPRAGPQSLAYVMFTSGSTGRPKGVMVPHLGLVNHMAWRQAAWPLTAGDRVLHKCTLAFDASVWELFWPLTAGVPVVVAPPGGHPDAGYLVRLARRESLTVLHFVPSTLKLFIEEPGVESCTSVRHVVSGGDALTPELRDAFYAKLPQATLVQSYGPTETSIAVIFNEARPGAEGDLVPLGRPIRNVRAYVLDRRGQLLPEGVSGELHIGGPCVARGYLRQPWLTARQFVPDPFSGEPGARLYRTGDRARLLADGSFEFGGRVDHQIKIRGVRIEPGEIEARLRHHPLVKEAVVVAYGESAGDRRLAAYVVPPRRRRPQPSDLRAFVLKKLPDYMVPSAFVVMRTLPMTPLGKLDRSALPAPSFEPVERPYVAPRNTEEKALAAIWAQLLGADRVGVDDNFFELGGHSLMATQMVSRVRDSFGVELSVRAVFQTPTVAALTEAIASSLK